jgi:cytochrome c oxidase subunit 2
MRGVPYAKLLGAVVVLTVVTSVIMLIPNWNGEQGSTAADKIDTLLDVMIVLSSFVFSIVMVMLVYSVWRWRARPGDESDGAPIHGNTRLEIAWTVIPTVIVLFGAIYSWIVLNDIEAKASDAMPLKVTAQQYKWTFEYPQVQVSSSNSQPVYLTSNELHVPVDRELDVSLTALDVIHSFWVPEWRIKRDAVPSGAGGDEIDNQFVVTPDQEGTFSLICTELCGIGHSTMRATVVVESQADFDKWVADQKAAQAKAAGATGSPAGASGT